MSRQKSPAQATHETALTDRRIRHITAIQVHNLTPHSHHDVTPDELTLCSQSRDRVTTSQVVKPVQMYKYLGMVVDPKLQWSAHVHIVAVCATWWTHQIARLSHISGGIPAHCIRQLYNTIAVLALTYAADVWYTRVGICPRGKWRIGLVAATKKLTSVQRKAATTISSALSTTAGNAAESSPLPGLLAPDSSTFLPSQTGHQADHQETLLPPTQLVFLY
ncbi:hypothetical protein H2248_011126 [Termitomyces sp. 'cryptogamus']|nr:hypothetical protein H2248_011126 [Termitomyces sp. 'cryptogamus']